MGERLRLREVAEDPEDDDDLQLRLEELRESESDLPDRDREDILLN